MKVPDIIKEAARNLRKNQTNSEKILWTELRYDKIGLRFLRQKPIYVFTEDDGFDRYIIPDFYCFDKKIIIEVDGGVHNLKDIYELDKYKEELLKNMGFKVIRIKNEEIKKDLEKVMLKIKNYIN